MSFPQVRLQRYRQTPAIRRLAEETQLSKKNFITPLFISEKLFDKRAISSMPGVFQHGFASFCQEVEKIAGLGLSSVLLFGIPEAKDPEGMSAYEEEGVIQRAIAFIKREFPHLVVIADCCLCEYTSHGQCGVMRGGLLHNDETLDVLQKVAVSYAAAGADIIAPSGMMDGMVRSIRAGLDRSDFKMVSIMSYAVKYASGFYSPFREAAGSGDVFTGDRKQHQLGFGQSREALREALLDIEEGADYLMVKPSLPYLDIVKLLRDETLHPIAVYHTSGEYAMLKLAAAANIIDERAVLREIFTGMRRAGANWIISYYAQEMAMLLNEEN